MTTRLDHLVVAARDLASGAEWVEARLGVALSPGGAHPGMGTHNRLLRLGDGVYLEVIAIDPDAPAPDRPRWFGLDEPTVAASLATRPRLVAWAAATTDIDRNTASAPFPLGPIAVMTRGDLTWRITIPADGRPVEHGAVPTLIQWPPGVHPTGMMPKSGCSLDRLIVRHPEPDRISQGLADIGFSDPAVRIVSGTPSLAVSINTPGGRALID